MNYLRGVRKDVVGRGSCLHLSFIIHVGFSALQREPPLMLTGCWPHLISWTCDPGFSLIGLCLKMQFITRSGLTHNLCDGSAFLGLIWLSASLKLNRSDNWQDWASSCGCGTEKCRCSAVCCWLKAFLVVLQQALCHGSKQRINLALWRPSPLPSIASQNEDSWWRRSLRALF